MAPAGTADQGRHRPRAASASHWPRGLGSLLANPGYRRLWAARTISQCGDIAQFTTLALLVYRLTGSGLVVSAVVVAEIVPVLTLAPVAGPVADRLPRVTGMVTADLARLVLAAVLAGDPGRGSVHRHQRGPALPDPHGLPAGQDGRDGPDPDHPLHRAGAASGAY